MRLPVLALLGASALAGCAPTLPAIGGDPASATTTVSSTSYRSPFRDSMKFGLVEPRPWRETNDRVRDLGGADAQMLGDSDEDPIPSGGATHGHKH